MTPNQHRSNLARFLESADLTAFVASDPTELRVQIFSAFRKTSASLDFAAFITAFNSLGYGTQAVAYGVKKPRAKRIKQCT